jgi:hypothetical protein
VHANTRRVVLAQIALLLPAALFMLALIFRGLTSGVLEPAASAAGQIVTWYADRLWTLWILLILLPLIAALAGGSALLSRPGRPERVRDAALPAIAGATLAAAGILAVVAVHVLMN